MVQFRSVGLTWSGVGAGEIVARNQEVAFPYLEKDEPSVVPFRTPIVIGWCPRPSGRVTPPHFLCRLTGGINCCVLSYLSSLYDGPNTSSHHPRWVTSWDPSGLCSPWVTRGCKCQTPRESTEALRITSEWTVSNCSNRTLHFCLFLSKGRRGELSIANSWGPIYDLNNVISDKILISGGVKY